MAAGDIADGISHRDEAETEREGGQDVSRVGVGACNSGGDGGAAADENERCRADELGKVFFGVCHKYTSFRIIWRLSAFELPQIGADTGDVGAGGDALYPVG